MTEPASDDHSPEATQPGPKPAEPAATPVEARSDDASRDGSETLSEGLQLKGIPRVVSLIVLLAVVLLIGVMFFRVMASFLVPLFLAAVLAVVFKPLHTWSLTQFEGRKQLAALATTVLISLGVLVPTALLGWMAYVETAKIVRITLAETDPLDDEENPILFGDDRSSLGQQELAEAAGVEPEEVAGDASQSQAPSDEGGWSDLVMGRLAPLTEWYRKNFPGQIDTARITQYVARYAVQIGLVGVQSLVGFVVGMAIMIFALYYFFADGPSIVETLMHLSPLDDDYERELLTQFANVSRAVVLATILSAVVQGVLAGVGYYFVLDNWSPPEVVASATASGIDVDPDQQITPPLFLLTVLTMLLAIVPFVGATAVWIPVVLWVYFAQGDLWPAVGMAVYGAAVVSSIDNLIKPYVLHGQSNLHPLLALLSVLGGLQLLGPIGILVGPMLVAFMQALLLMLRKELDVLAQSGSGQDDQPRENATPQPA